MDILKWKQVDFLIISGDAYIDHPSFGTALIGRYLESLGFKVGIIAQPDWRNPKVLKELGKPRLAALISAGNMDSMLNHYTARKNRRKNDAYSPGGKIGMRPDRATIVYTNLIKQIYNDIPVIIGGVEASLRRLVHYDYWDNSLRRSILIDSKADLLIFGMAEFQIKRVANMLNENKDWDEINNIPGVCYVSKEISGDYKELPSFEDCMQSKKSFAEACRDSYLEQDPIRGKKLVQKHQDRFLVQNPPAPPLSTKELDHIYQLPYQRTLHPQYKGKEIPAIKEVKYSITSHRGCFGACAFCAIHFHQGRIIQRRSHKSIINEAKSYLKDKDFKGYIHDVGGPTANFRSTSCDKQLKSGTCRNKQCLFPKPCPNLKVDHSDYFNLLKTLRNIEGIKKVFVRSGIRYDYLLLERNDKYLEDLCKHHISGQLKVAPEHASPSVTSMMGKPSIEVYNRFREKYKRINNRIGKNQFLIPYFMSGHPGTTLKDAVIMAEYLRDYNFQPDQVQEFIPTPGSLSTCMYYSGISPLSMKKVHVPQGEEKIMQRALLQYKKPENLKWVIKALKKAGREDLIGNSKNSLVSIQKKN